MKQKIFTGLVLSIVALVGIGYYVSTNVRDHGDTTSVPEHNDNVALHEISPSDVVKKVQSNDNVVLLDVRTPEEYEEIHLENALLLPVQELSQQSLEQIGLGEDAKDKEIIIYCRSGARSQTAYNIMESLGYTNIKSVAGGMIHWQEDNYPLTETGLYTGPLSESEVEDVITDTEGPRIALRRDLHDFGVIPQYGGTVETAFVVANNGTENLEIGQITTSCSCTTASIAETIIEPGNETTLTVVFDPNLHEEPLDVFTRTVFIPTNDPNTPEAEVRIQVDIAEGE